MRGWHRCGLQLSAVLIAVTALSQTGCVGLTAHMMYFFYGNKISARYDGLEDKRVAVICTSGSALGGPGSTSYKLAKALNRRLAMEVPGIDVVPQQKVANWQDNNDWDGFDFRQVGRGVKAEMLVVVTLNGYSLHKGPTLYQGKTDFNVAVYDMTEDGKVVYEPADTEFTFPIRGAVPVTDTTESRFEGKFLAAVVEDVAMHFYDYDAGFDVASDNRAFQE